VATNPDLTDAASQGRGGPAAADLMTRAGNGDKQAWDALAERYAPLTWSICRRHGLGDADAEDAGQTVWLKLAGQLEKLRLPAALPAGRHNPPGMRSHPARGRRDHAIPAMRPAPRPSPTMTPGQPRTNCSRPGAARPCARRSRTCRPAVSSCSSCSPRALPRLMPRSAPGWASRPAASARTAAAAWTNCAATRPSPR
jgi:hypothetical protein